jgi:hypothetical protein
MPDYIPGDCNFFRNDNYIIITDEQSYKMAIKKNPEIKQQAGNLIFL